MACEACHHMKASCSWMKRTARETWKWKWVSEETEAIEMVKVGEDDEEEGTDDDPGHTVHGVLQIPEGLLGFSREVFRVMDTITLELKWANDLKEEEMGKAKGKEKEKEEELRRRRMEDKDRDTEMGGAGPLSLV
ncbi:hypothetical protein ID866_9409 [Astraeus odoratus]|nr:hypothetical protein ID866_9409 [Astraeus odoratus]